MFTFISIALYSIQTDSKQLHCNKQYREVIQLWKEYNFICTAALQKTTVSLFNLIQFDCKVHQLWIRLDSVEVSEQLDGWVWREYRRDSRSVRRDGWRRRSRTEGVVNGTASAPQMSPSVRHRRSCRGIREPRHCKHTHTHREHQQLLLTGGCEDTQYCTCAAWVSVTQIDISRQH